MVFVDMTRPLLASVLAASVLQELFELLDVDDGGLSSYHPATVI